MKASDWHFHNHDLQKDYQSVILHVAYFNGHLDVVLEMINSGTDVNAALDNGCTTLHLASADGHMDIVTALIGAGADVKWLRNFQSIVNKKYNEYNPTELIDWNERQNDELQEKGRKCGVEIEKYMKKSILSKLQEIFNDKWDLEIGSIKRECVDRALQEDEKNHKEGIVKESCDWKDMFNINDYKTIIEKHWSKKPDNNTIADFKTFENEFSIDTGNGFNSKAIIT